MGESFSVDLKTNLNKRIVIFNYNIPKANKNMR